MDAPIQYATAGDGTRLAFAVRGEGPPLLIAPEFVESFSLEDRVPELASFMARLGAGRTVARYDLRGTGLSRGGGGGSRAARIDLDVLADDLRCVADAAGFDRFDHFATSTAGPVALTFAAQYPQRLRRLALYGTLRRQSEMAPARVLDPFIELIRTNWELASWTIGESGGPRETHPAFVSGADDNGPGGLGALYAASTTGEVAAAIISACVRIDLTPILPSIRTETLVLHKRGDPTFPFEGGRRLAASLVNALFIPLDGNVSSPMGRGDDRVIDPVRAFFEQTEREPSPGGATATHAALSPREQEVLRLLAGGASNREISEQLVLSERTVARHVANIYTKIGVHGRAEAAGYAYRLGLSRP